MIIGINLIAEYSIKGAGTFTYIKNIFEQWAYYDFPDCHFILYKQRHIPKEHLAIPSNVDIEYVNVPILGGGIKRILFEQTFFYLYLKKCDVFYSYCSSMPLFVNAKRYFTLHDLCFLSPEKENSWPKRTYLKIINALYIKRSTKVLTVSEFSKKEICRVYKIQPDKIEVTYNFIPRRGAEAVNDKKEIKDINGDIFSTNKRYALFVGSLQPAKNIIGMIQGFECFRKTHPDFYLVIVGKPLYKAAKILDTIYNSENIVYLGYQSDENVACLYNNCQFTVLLSFTEGFGIPPLEGFLYGKPALVSNTSSLPEVVGLAGKQVSPYDINKIASGYEDIYVQRHQYQQEINKQLNNFDPFKIIEKFLSVLGIPYIRLSS